MGKVETKGVSGKFRHCKVARGRDLCGNFVRGLLAGGEWGHCLVYCYGELVFPKIVYQLFGGQIFLKKFLEAG